MFGRFSEWLQFKWNRPENLEDERKASDYDIQLTFSTPHGRRVLDRLLSEHYCTISHVPTGRCCDTAFNEGQRSVVHELLEALERAEKNLYGGSRDTDNSDANTDSDASRLA